MRLFRLRFGAILLAGATLAACATPPDAETAVTPPPVDSERLLALADESRAAGALADAQAHYRLVLEHEPEHAGARLGLAEIHLANGRLRDAERLFDGLAERAGDLPPATAARAFQGQGLARLRREAMDEAEVALRRAVKTRPDLWRAWNALGLLHDAREEWRQAAASYERALDLRPESAVVLNNQGYSLLLQGRYAEAAEVLTQALRQAPQNRRIRANLRLALAWQGQYREATLGASADARPRVLNDVGYIALLRGDHTAAEGLFVQAMEASPKHFAPAALNLAHVRDLHRPDIQEAEAPPAVVSDDDRLAAGPPLSLLDHAPEGEAR